MMSTDSLLERPERQQADSLSYYDSHKSSRNDTQDYLIFFLTGNPGLISYYAPFLSKLNTLLATTSSEKIRFFIRGHSYKGFELSKKDARDTPAGLDEQVRYQESILLDYVQEHHETTGKMPKVILMGHSVGSYVLLELIQRHVDAVSPDYIKDFDLIGGILLFPTIAEIAQSPLGRVARLVLPLPGFARTIGAIARGLGSILPDRVLRAVVKMVTKFPFHAAEATAAFLKSPLGVRQALYLARDEMRMITEADWDEEVWGAATAPGTNKRDTINWNLVLYWGKGDKWVADHTRDKLIEARGIRNELVGKEQEGKSRMEIDQDGIPHDFCTTIRNSHAIAGKVKGWVEDIIDAHREAMQHQPPSRTSST